MKSMNTDSGEEERGEERNMARGSGEGEKEEKWGR